jgi:hypothetical protein
MVMKGALALPDAMEPLTLILLSFPNFLQSKKYFFFQQEKKKKPVRLWLS